MTGIKILIQTIVFISDFYNLLETFLYVFFRRLFSKNTLSEDFHHFMYGKPAKTESQGIGKTFSISSNTVLSVCFSFRQNDNIFPLQTGSFFLKFYCISDHISF